MAQYQSFPDAAGDSRTFDKLKALRLPSLQGKRFLDVGCNEGFFCGYARFDGAVRAVGVDHSAGFIARARRRYPDCEFFQQGWDCLPEGPFDVILLASALHYADDQPALVDALVGRLAPDGVLVLEMGIASSPRSEWVKVKRGIDERIFPSMAKVRELLDRHAWKWMGPSVLQDGDPVPRHVIHVSPMRPHAYLLMQPPAHGKSTIARVLFDRASIPVVSGDEVILRVVKGTLPAPANLRALLAEDYSPYRLDETVRRAFDAGLGSELVRLWIADAPPADLAVDAYVPQQWHGLVRTVLAEAGFHPVTLLWDRAGMALNPGEQTLARAEAYQASLAAGPGLGPLPYAGGARGFVDAVERERGQLRVRGWAVDAGGAFPQAFSVRIGGRELAVAGVERVPRPNVRDRLGLADADCGYIFNVPLAADAGEDWFAGFQVRAADRDGSFGPPLLLSANLARQWGRQPGGEGGS